MIKTLGKYKIRHELGKGAMGVVYLAFDPDLQREVAVKTIAAASTIDDPSTRERFIREARSAGRLKHQNIITIYDFGKEGEQMYIAMEYLDGKDLDAIIAEGSRLDIKEKLDIVRQICIGLDYAHSHDVYHRDIKPANIKVLKDGTVKIMDFGLAIVQASSITHTGTVLGTPHYMAPEIIQGQKADARADQFSVGAVMYELLTQKKPFSGETIPALMYNLIHHQPRDLDPDFKDQFPEIDYIIKKSLNKDPGLRYDSIKQMADHIEALLARMRELGFSMTDSIKISQSTMDSGPVPTQVLPDTARDTDILRLKRKHRLMSIALSFAALVILLFAIYFFIFNQPVKPLPGPGFLLFDVKPYAIIESIVDLNTGQAVLLAEENKITPVRITLPPGPYKVTYSHPRWDEKRIREVTITPGNSLMEKDIQDPLFIEDAIRHFYLAPVLEKK